MSVPDPPVDLPAPNRRRLRAGEPLHRVHRSDFGGAAFNPCRGRPTRFAPIQDAAGRCVPSLYAGTSVEAAIFETVFHDVPPEALFKTVPKQDVVARSHSVIAPVREIALVELRAPDLKKWGLAHGALISAPAAAYERTARWAEAIHRQFDDVEGLVWTSNQCDPESAFVFFGDRVGEAAFEVVSTRRGDTDDGFLSDVRAAGARAGITITV